MQQQNHWSGCQPSAGSFIQTSFQQSRWIPKASVLSRARAFHQDWITGLQRIPPPSESTYYCVARQNLASKSNVNQEHTKHPWNGRLLVGLGHPFILLLVAPEYGKDSLSILLCPPLERPSSQLSHDTPANTHSGNQQARPKNLSSKALK